MNREQTLRYSHEEVKFHFTKKKTKAQSLSQPADMPIYKSHSGKSRAAKRRSHDGFFIIHIIIIIIVVKMRQALQNAKATMATSMAEQRPWTSNDEHVVFSVSFWTHHKCAIKAKNIEVKWTSGWSEAKSKGTVARRSIGCWQYVRVCVCINNVNAKNDSKHIRNTTKTAAFGRAALSTVHSVASSITLFIFKSLILTSCITAIRHGTRSSAIQIAFHKF